MDELTVAELKTSELYLARPMNVLLDDFRAGQAAPGSGSAAALMSALAAKLLITVCEVTLRNSPPADKKARFETIRLDSSVRADSLLTLFENDAADFNEVVELKKAARNSDDPVKKAAYTRKANDLLEQATNNVFSIMEISLPLARDAIRAFDDGSKHVRGDSGAALSATIAAIQSGLCVVALNLKALQDRQYSKSNLSRCEMFQTQLRLLQSTAMERVRSVNVEARNAVVPNEQLSLF